MVLPDSIEIHMFPRLERTNSMFPRIAEGEIFIRCEFGNDGEADSNTDADTRPVVERTQSGFTEEDDGQFGEMGSM